MAARAGDQLAEITWDAPTPDDPSITGYTVTTSPADTSPITADQTARTGTVTGLSNGTPYTFTVTATNPDGTSPPSEPSAPVTPTPAAASTLTLAAAPNQRPLRRHGPAFRPAPSRPTPPPTPPGMTAATVRIHTGRGTTRAGHLFLGSGRPIWNNDGDTGTLIDPHNVAVRRYRF